MSRTLALLILAVAALVTPPAYGQLFEAHYLFRGGYPIHQTQWSNGVEGAAHDDDHWFFTETSPPEIFKLPVGSDLLTAGTNSPGALRFQFAPGHVMWNAGYRDFGDPDVYRFNGVDYLVVPVTGVIVSPDDCFPPAAVAFFRCSDLTYVDYAELPGQCGDAPWVAVSGNGEIYSSRTHIGLNDPSQLGLRVYTLDWATLANSNDTVINFSRDAPLVDEDGAVLELVTMQGGEFVGSPGTELEFAL